MSARRANIEADRSAAGGVANGVLEEVAERALEGGGVEIDEGEVRVDLAVDLDALVVGLRAGPLPRGVSARD